MGFKELESFNMALLAKQLWRIISRPYALVAKILKDKYFNYKTAMEEVNVKRSAFLIWKSLTVAREILNSRIRWRVGNGNKIKFWKDQWLPNPSTFKVQ